MRPNPVALRCLHLMESLDDGLTREISDSAQAFSRPGRRAHKPRMIGLTLIPNLPRKVCSAASPVARCCVCRLVQTSFTNLEPLRRTYQQPRCGAEDNVTREGMAFRFLVGQVRLYSMCKGPLFGYLRQPLVRASV